MAHSLMSGEQQKLSLKQLAAPLLVVLIWGVNTVMVKYMVIGLPPLVAQAFRMVLGAVFLFSASMMSNINNQRGWRWILTVSPRTFWLAFAAAISGILVHHILMGYGMALGKAGLNSLILALNPLAMSVLAHFFLAEGLRSRQVIGVLLGFSGVVAAVGNNWQWSTAGAGWGEILILAAMLTFVLGGLFIRKARGLLPALHFTALIQVIGALLLAIPATLQIAVEGFPQLPGELSFWLILLASGTIASGLCVFLWNRSIQEIGAAKTSLFINLMPVISLFTASIVFDEAMTVYQWLGLIAVVAGVYLGTGAVHRGTQGKVSRVLGSAK